MTMATVKPVHDRTIAPSLDIGYVRAVAIDELLNRPGTLAVLGFGSVSAMTDDPRVMNVPLQPLLDDAPAFEHWRVADTIRHGRDGELAWAHGGGYLFVGLRVEEEAHGGIRRAAAHAYRRMLQALNAHGHPYLLRAWNYLADINAGRNDDERYRHFTMGRAEGLTALPPDNFPAATAIGRLDGVRELFVYALASKMPGLPIENPRQISAYRYPRQYGPVPPSFARAMRVDTLTPALLISGTASVVGHATVHDQPAAQAAETLRNLESLLTAAGGIDSKLSSDAWLKAYLRDPAFRQPLDAALAAKGIPPDRVVYLHGDICRIDLLLEIDGVARL